MALPNVGISHTPLYETLHYVSFSNSGSKNYFREYSSKLYSWFTIMTKQGNFTSKSNHKASYFPL